MKKFLSTFLLLFAFSLSMFADLDIKTYVIKGNLSELGLKDGENVDVILNEERNMSFTHPWMYAHAIELDKSDTGGYILDGWKQVKYKNTETGHTIYVEFSSGDARHLSKKLRIKVGISGKYCYLEQQ